MSKPTNIIIPIIVLGVTILGLTAIVYGGLIDIQFGPDSRIKIIGPVKEVVQE